MQPGNCTPIKSDWKEMWTAIYGYLSASQYSKIFHSNSKTDNWIYDKASFLDVSPYRGSLLNKHLFPAIWTLQFEKFTISWKTFIAHLKWKKVKLLSHVWLFATPWTVAYKAPPSMGFFRQEYWSGLPFPSPDLPNPGIEPGSPTLQADALPSKPPGKSSLIWAGPNHWPLNSI